MYSDLGPPAPAGLNVAGLGSNVHRFGAPGVGLRAFFVDGTSGAEAGRREEDVGLQTREASVSNLASWRPGLVLG